MRAERSMAGDVDLLGLLSDDARSRVLLGARSFTLPAGTVTTSSQDTVADVVESGLVRIFVRSADGRQASFAYVHSHSFYGAPTILGVGMSTSAQTLIETRLIRLDAGHVSALFEEDLEVAKALAHVMASRIGQAARLVTVRSLGTVRERLAYDLLERASDQLLRGDASSLRVTHEDLAESIGSAREVVSRALAELRKSGVVNAAHGVVSVLDVERLAAIVEGLIE
jgi:CRP/FNR family cyclic AMP-dependent transcriptional regulator